jgi:hypothetical protein
MKQPPPLPLELPDEEGAEPGVVKEVSLENVLSSPVPV